MAEPAPQRWSGTLLEWAEAGRLCANSLKPLSQALCLLLSTAPTKRWKIQSKTCPRCTAVSSTYSADSKFKQDSALTMGYKTSKYFFEPSCLSYNKAKTFFLWKQNQIRGFVVRLSLQRNYRKLARTLALTVQTYYLHCICTGLAQVTFYHYHGSREQIRFARLAIWPLQS